MLFFVISFLASVVGAICGIGGGVIIKPTLDIFALAEVSVISFLSGCSVLSMSVYSVGKSLSKKEGLVDVKTGTPLAIGSVVGGMAGNQIFHVLRDMSDNPNKIGAVQAGVLAVITLLTLVYMIFQRKIHTKRVESKAACVLIGAVLGFFSSFLGIGGGPINLVVLHFFFSMETKTAAANSLYIILFSQAASLLTTIVSGTVPSFEIWLLVFMVAGGISGGIIGRILSRKMSDRLVANMLKILMAVIIGFCFYNIYQYS